MRSRGAPREMPGPCRCSLVPGRFPAEDLDDPEEPEVGRRVGRDLEGPRCQFEQARAGDPAAGELAEVPAKQGHTRSSGRYDGRLPAGVRDGPIVEIDVGLGEIDRHIGGDDGFAVERRRIGDRGMIGDGRAEVGPGLGRLDDIHPDIIDVDAIAVESPIHEGHLGVDGIAGPGLEAAGGHADRVPTASLGQIKFHEVAVEVICFLCIEMKIDAARGVIGPDAGFDPELEAGLREAGKVERAGNAADDEGPPHVPSVPRRVDRDRGEAPARAEVHDRAAFTRPKAPAFSTRRVLGEGRPVEVVAELGRERSAEEDRRGQDEPRSSQGQLSFHAARLRACSRSYAGSLCATRCRRGLRRPSSGRRR